MLIFDALGPQSRIQRFLGPRPLLSERDVSIVTRLDDFDHAGVIAFAGSPSSPVGAAHLVRADDSPELAEIAIEVVDEWQGRGIGRLLIERLRECAVRAGVRRFEWLSFESNLAVAALARDLREVRRDRVGDGVIKCSAAIWVTVVGARRSAGGARRRLALIIEWNDSREVSRGRPVAEA